MDEFVSDIFESLTGLSARVLQDSRADAYGEYILGNGKGSNTLICITLGTGIGTGLVIDGEIYHGALLAAGELGHIPVADQGRPCGCGKNGCLECYAAGKGLDQTAKEFYGEDATAKDLFNAAEKGDEDAIFAINPATPLSVIEESLNGIDVLLIMTVNPGFAGQKLVDGAFDKIKRARKMLDDVGRSDVLLEVDGNCSFENIPKMYEAGADTFVVGTSSVFHKDYTFETAITTVFESLK